MSFWEQLKEKAESVQLKLKMIFLENNIEAAFLRLGSRTYDHRQRQGNFWEDPEIQPLLRDITAKKKELAAMKEDFYRLWREESRELKVGLEKGGGTLEQVELLGFSPVRDKQVKDLDLPKDVLLGPILRGPTLIIPDGETVLQEGDRITLMGKRGDVEATARLLKG